MFETGKRFVQWGAIAAAALSAAPALAAEPSYEQLQQEVQSLRAKVEAIESRQRADSRDVAATIDAVLRDAEKRSQLLAAGGGVNAGYDNGFFIRNDDGSFLLKPAINAQFRSVTTYRESGKGSDEHDIQSGFEWRRLRFRFDGNAFSKDLTYSFVWDAARQGGSVTLLDAWVQYQFAEELAFKVGQFKASVFQERNLSGFTQLAVDRSLVDALIAGGLIDRVQGAALIYGGKEKDPLRAELAFHDGGNSKNTNFLDEFDNSSPADGTDDRPDWGVSGRVKWKAAGDWKSYRDFSAVGNKSDLLVLAAGGNIDGAPKANVYLGTVEAQWETGALGVFAAGFVRHRDRRGNDELTDYGALVQAGYLVAPAWEVFARYDVTFFDEDGVSSGREDTFQEITVGVSHFLGKDGSAKHRAKVTVDLTYLPDGSPSSQDGLGILSGEDDQWLVRGQFQLLI